MAGRHRRKRWNPLKDWFRWVVSEVRNDQKDVGWISGELSEHWSLSITYREAT
jgi:hypothetical protein